MTYILKIKADTPELAEKYKNHSHFHPGDSGIDLFIHSVQDNGEQVSLSSWVQCHSKCGCQMSIMAHLQR